MIKFAAKTSPTFKDLDLLRRLQYKYVELYTTNKTINSAYTMAMIDGFSSFEYVIHAPCDTFDKNIIRFALDIGAKLIIVHKVIANEQLKEIVNEALVYGIRVAVENVGIIDGTQSEDYVRTSEDFFNLLKKVHNIDLCVDVEHACIENSFPWILYTCRDFLTHIHLSGWDSKVKKYHEPVYQNVNLFKETLLALKTIKYDGFVVCEHSTKYNTEEIWRWSKELFEKIR